MTTASERIMSMNQIVLEVPLADIVGHTWMDFTDLLTYGVLAAHNPTERTGLDPAPMLDQAVVVDHYEVTSIAEAPPTNVLRITVGYHLEDQ